MSRKRTSHPAHGKRRIFVVDDHPLVRRGLKALINAEPDLMVCGEAASLQEGRVAVPAVRPDLVVVDVSLGDDDGLQLVREIAARRPRPRILVLTMHEAHLHIEQAFAAGADGYVAKRELTETLLTAIRGVLRGETFRPPGG
jgi:DNA-binding NarL/FixJ family response regulator